MRKHIDVEVAAWEAKLEAVLTRRGEVVSALMKSIRLQREADAVYWMKALLDSGVDRGYLGRRCFGSACEDSLSLVAMEMGSGLVLRPSRRNDLPYFESVLASCRAVKWYTPVGSEYTLARCATWEAPRVYRDKTDSELLEIATTALDREDPLLLMQVHRELHARRRGGFVFVDLLVAAAQGRETPVQRLAALCARHRWLIVKWELNPVWQLIWVLCRGPFAGSEDPVSLDGLDRLLTEVAQRWEMPDLEPIPAWCLDGVHTVGNDERFAGTWRGLRNMLAMYARYGRIDPADGGILVRPVESTATGGVGD